MFCTSPNLSRQYLLTPSYEACGAYPGPSSCVLFYKVVCYLFINLLVTVSPPFLKNKNQTLAATYQLCLKAKVFKASSNTYFQRLAKREVNGGHIMGDHRHSDNFVVVFCFVFFNSMNQTH